MSRKKNILILGSTMTAIVNILQLPQKESTKRITDALSGLFIDLGNEI